MDAGIRDDGAKSYAFYDMLPKFEVVVPEKEKDVRPDIRAVPETRRGTYVFADPIRILQTPIGCGPSWRCRASMEELQRVSVGTKRSWHRIRIGPISKLDELNRLRTILRKADVDVLVIRVGD